MRSFAPIALAGTLFFAAGLDAQSLTEHAAAAAGATIGTAAGKPLSNALGSIFGKLDKDTSDAAKTPKKVAKPAEPTPAKASAAPSLSSSAPSSSPSAPSDSGISFTPRWQSPRATAAAPVTYTYESRPAPIVREPSLADIASIKLGASSQELQSSLGVPESRITIPEDDGRMLESCQYWSRGQLVGTVRLVNGQVVSVQSNSN